MDKFEWVISILCVVIGFALSELSNYFKEKRSEKNASIAFIEESNSIKSKINDQINALRKFVSELDEPIVRRLDFRFSNTLSYIKSIDWQKLINYNLKYHGKEQTKNVGDILNAIGFLESQNDKGIQLITAFDVRSNELTIEFHRHWAAYTRVLIEYVSKGMEDEFCIESAKLFQEVYGNRTTMPADFTTREKEYIIPAWELHRKYAHSNVAQQLNTHLYACWDAIKEMNALRNMNKEIFENLTKSFEMAYLKFDVKINV